ncbi:MAG: PD40 domain-containing protein [Opitutae bacterium]|nr:PD40 domain-containing protein [Opitutae bacterium]
MKKLFSLCLLAILCPALVSAAASNASDLGVISKGYDISTLSIHVSGSTPELNALANTAFNAHKRYKVVQSGGQFEAKFTQVAPNQVKVEITRGSTPVHTQVVSGTSTRHALLKAADVAVEKTNGLGLRGFFASKLAFVSERTGKREIYVGDLFFGEVKRITHDGALKLSPRWAPDGNRIVYTSYFRTGFPDIYQVDPHTGMSTTLVSLKGTNGSARFSPDGRQLTMILSGEGNPEVYVGNAQGKLVRRLTRTPEGVEASPCFSPDGSRLVFTSDIRGRPQLFTMSISGGSMVPLPTGGTYCAEPDWSRGNPNKIAYTLQVGRSFQIAVFDMAARESKRMPSAPFDAVEPSWLADGRHLVYTARNPSESHICILDTESGQSTPVSGSGLGTVQQASVYGP